MDGSVVSQPRPDAFIIVQVLEWGWLRCGPSGSGVSQCCGGLSSLHSCLDNYDTTPCHTYVPNLPKGMQWAEMVTHSLGTLIHPPRAHSPPSLFAISNVRQHPTNHKCTCSTKPTSIGKTGLKPWCRPLVCQAYRRVTRPNHGDAVEASAHPALATTDMQAASEICMLSFAAVCGKAQCKWPGCAGLCISFWINSTRALLHSTLLVPVAFFLPEAWSTKPLGPVLTPMRALCVNAYTYHHIQQTGPDSPGSKTPSRHKHGKCRFIVMCTRENQ